MQLIRQILLILSDKFLRIMFGFWLLSTTILFLINYRAYLPPEINRHIEAPRSKLRGIFDRRE